MSAENCTNIPPTWTPEAKAAYVACAIDTDGWIGLRPSKRTDGTYRLEVDVGVTNTSREFLERISVFAGVPLRIFRNGRKGEDWRKIVTRGDVWQIRWTSPPHIIAILELALPYLLAKRQRAIWCLEFCHSRIGETGLVVRSGRPYTPRSWELAQLVSAANGRQLKPIQTPTNMQ